MTLSFLRIGHRGARSLEPENTLLSFRRAIELGVDAVEMDVRKTRDNKLVIIHDERVDRTTNGSGLVSEMTLEELKKLDAGKGEAIPTLDEAIGLCRGRVRMLIELKEDGMERDVAGELARHGVEGECEVISFKHSRLLRIKEISPDIRTGALFVGFPVRPHQLARDAEADLVVAQHSFVTPEFVELCHKNNVRVYVWNINDRETVKRHASFGVDGIATDDPRVFEGL